MGRPSITGDSIVVVIDGDLLIWTDGLLSGTNKALIDAAYRLSKYELPVELSPFGPEIPASLDIVTSPERALAAMMGAKPGRARVLEAPKSVLALIPFMDEEESGTDSIPDSNKEEQNNSAKE